MKKDILIIGASGFGREVAWLIEELEEWNIKGFIDDNENLRGKTINEYEVLGNCDDLMQFTSPLNVVIAIGNPKIRKQIYQKLSKKSNILYPNIIANDVRISNTNRLGIGNIICTHTILTTNITIGNFNHINLSCTLGHDALLKDYVTVYPGVNISGNVVVGSLAELGTGSKIIQGITISGEIIVGAGGVIVKDLTNKGNYVGIPVRRIGK